MQRYLVLIAVLFFVVTGWAQDGPDGGGDGGFFGGDGGDLFGGGNNGGGNRGRAQAPDRLTTLKDMLTKASVPLSRDQERTLNTLLDKEIPAMSEAFRARFGQDPGAAPGAGAARGQGRGQQPAQGAGPGANRGGLRGGPGAGADNPMAAEIRRMNEELLAKVTATLTPDQQTVLKKFQNDQIRARGGFDALRLVLEDAGAPPLSAEQAPQIQALYAEENAARIQLLRESQGQPDPAKISQLQLGTMTKIARILNAEQRKALLDSMAKARQQ